MTFIRKPLVAGLFALASLSLSSYALAAKDVVLATSSPPETMDPYNTNSTITTAVTKSIYEGLFEFDKDLKVRPVLAESYKVSESGLEYTFILKQGVKFHDGTPFNAAAVKVNLDRVINPDNRLTRINQFNRIASVDVISDYVVKITLKEKFAPFINSLAHASAAMISPAALAKYGKDIGLNPVGTGPFKFVEWRQPDFVKVERFADYWRQGYPKVDTITWRPVIENGARVAMLQTGEADFTNTVPPEQAEVIKGNSKLNLLTGDSIVLYYISLNTLQKPFDNPKVREALNYAINRDAFTKVVYSGYARPADGIIPTGVRDAVKLQPWPYDPKKARELLKEAGYPNGFETDLWAAYNDTTSQKAVQFFQQQLQQVGIKAKVQALETGQRVELINGVSDPQKAKVRMYYTGWSSSTGEADWATRPLLASEAWPPGLYNTSYYKNPVVDQAIASALVTTDDAERQALYKTVQETVWKDAPWIPVAIRTNVYAANKRLSGVYVMPDGNINFTEISVSE